MSLCHALVKSFDPFEFNLCLHKNKRINIFSAYSLVASLSANLKKSDSKINKDARNYMIMTFFY